MADLTARFAEAIIHAQELGYETTIDYEYNTLLIWIVASRYRITNKYHKRCGTVDVNGIVLDVHTDHADDIISIGKFIPGHESGANDGLSQKTPLNQMPVKLRGIVLGVLIDRLIMSDAGYAYLRSRFGNVDVSSIKSKITELRERCRDDIKKLLIEKLNNHV